MSIVSNSVVCSVAALLMATPVSAQSPNPGQPATTLAELASQVTVGSTLVVTDAAGRVTTGRLSALSPASLSIAVGDRVETYAPAQIQEIRHRLPDSKLNGGLLGLAVGFGAPAVACAASRSDEAGVCAGIALFVGGLPGFLIGMGVDAVQTRKEVVFRTPESRSTRFHLAPVLGPGRIQVQASVRFGEPGAQASAVSRKGDK